MANRTRVGHYTAKCQGVRMIFVLLLLSLTTGPINAAGWWSVLYNGLSSMVGLTYSAVGPEDAYLGIDQLALKYGYPLEAHTVVSADEYILKMHRIPHGKKGKSRGASVFLMHGIWESSDSWLLQGPGKALAYLLADEGYDVWLGNARGNRHTYDHKTFNASSSRFWEFSWEEIGMYDLPAMIDYALNATSRKSLYYVGYSQGTTSFFVMTSMKPEYNRKVKIMYALAPEVFMSHATSWFLKIFSPAANYLPLFIYNFNIYTPDFLSSFSPIFCALSPISCENFFLSLVGAHNVSDTVMPVVVGHTPTGSSLMQFLHYGQLLASNKFCRYDFGWSKNLQRYGRGTPPDYSLNKVTAPVVLFYSDRDVFSSLRDVEMLKTRLPNVRKEFYVKDFSHIDYMYADMSKTYVYANIVKDMNNDFNKTLATE